MALELRSEDWVGSCDLCGDLHSRPLHLPGIERARRCRSCGLITTVPSVRRPLDRQPALRSALDAVEQSVVRAARGGASRALLIGHPSGQIFDALRRTGMNVIVLAEDEHEPCGGIVVHAASVDQAPFLPDQFDVIACLTPLETFDSPALLMERCRQWLGAGGLLLLGGNNWRSIGAQLSRRTWLERNAREARHLLGPRQIRRYADRFGFDVRTLQTYSRLDRRTDGDVARSSAGIAFSVFMAPFTLAASFAGFGDEIYVELVKRGAATKPLPARAKEERDTSPGLAPAMYREGSGQWSMR